MARALARMPERRFCESGVDSRLSVGLSDCYGDTKISAKSRLLSHV